MRRSLRFMPALLLAAGCGDGGGSSTTTGMGGSGGGSSTSSTSASTSMTTTTGTPAPAIVETDKGKVKSVISEGVRASLGIPFAAPPTGARRWKPPEPAAAWSDVLDATKKGPECPQLASLGNGPKSGTSEDCLNLNVWTRDTLSDKPAPVLVWIHGGGFTGGSGSELTYDGAALALATGAVVVTVNYRLGPLGFLGHSALAAEDPAHPGSGMYGFEDQRAALAWVKANAAAFGGDPSNVTVFGESAGGVSTCLHLFSPKSAGLFDRVIIQSGACSFTGGTEATAEAQGDDLAKAVGCTDAATMLDCLRGKTADELLVALPKKPAEIGPNGASWLPIVDGVNIPDQPKKLLDAGSFTKVPTLLGSNKDEGSIFFAIGLTVSDDAEYQKLMDDMFSGHGAEIVAKYPASAYASRKEAAAAAVGDGLFICPTRRTARGIAKTGTPTFMYHFTHAPKALLAGLGVFHSAEVPFIFRNPYLGIVLDDAEEALSNTMIGYWLRHAETGNPSGDGAPMWPKYEATNGSHVVLDLSISTAQGLHDDACDFWDPIGP